MNYNLKKANKESRKRFVRYANMLLRKERSNVRLIDESGRTPEQNSYMHVLCRIMALETGVSENYSKQVYFKEFANPDLFKKVTKDPITGKMVTLIRRSRDLTIPEMRKAISNFRMWAAENGYELPDATINDDGSVTFASSKDEEAYNQAIVATSQAEDYL